MTTLTLVWLLAHLPIAVHDAARAKVVRTAVENALPPLLAGAAGHVEQKTCFACHNQTYPVLALTTGPWLVFKLWLVPYLVFCGWLVAVL